MPGAQHACSKAQAKFRFVAGKAGFNCFVRNPPRRGVIAQELLEAAYYA